MRPAFSPAAPVQEVGPEERRRRYRQCVSALLETSVHGTREERREIARVVNALYDAVGVQERTKLRPVGPRNDIAERVQVYRKVSACLRELLPSLRPGRERTGVATALRALPAARHGARVPDPVERKFPKRWL